MTDTQTAPIIYKSSSSSSSSSCSTPPWSYLTKQVLNPFVLSQPFVLSPIGSEKQVSLVAASKLLWKWYQSGWQWSWWWWWWCSWPWWSRGWCIKSVHQRRREKRDPKVHYLHGSELIWGSRAPLPHILATNLFETKMQNFPLFPFRK